MRTGCAFAGWYKDAALTTVWNFESDTVTWNTILRAKWTLNTYTVSFNTNGGSAVEAQTVATGGKVTLPANPVRTGYTFAGWYKEAALVNTWNFGSDTVTADITLWAKWTPITYTITWNADGWSGELTPTFYTIESAAITLPVLTKRGYTFGGWYDNSGLTGSAVTVIPQGSTGDKTFWAKWTLNAINLTDSAYSGSGVSYSGGVFTIADGAEVTVSGSTTGNRIAVSGTATIILDGASIDMSGAGAVPAIYAIGANLTLVLTGSSTVKGGPYLPGVCTNGTGRVTIKGSGSLTAAGGRYAAGIGGSWGHDNGTVVIESGTVNAKGSNQSAGIGGGCWGSGGSIIISGGTVNALSVGGMGNPAGIGGGAGGSSGNVSILGGHGTAYNPAGRAVGAGARGSYGVFTGPDGGHDWPAGGTYTW